MEPALWDKVQELLGENRVERSQHCGAAGPSLLTGLVFDGAGGRMSPSNASKKGLRYRYYVSQSLIRSNRAKQLDRAGACRVPAADLEGVVEAALCDALQDAPAVHDVARAVNAG